MKSLVLKGGIFCYDHVKFTLELFPCTQHHVTWMQPILLI